jgi:SpoOM protein
VPDQAAVVIDRDSWGLDWHVELDRALLIPGTLVDGTVRIHSTGGIAARALVVQLVGVEHWRHRVERTDAEGHTTTEVVTTKGDPVREPVIVAQPVAIAAGETFERSFQLPVPPDGPASLDATDAGMTWTFEAKLDIEGSLDSGVEASVVVAQPTALLRAGGAPVAAFALFDEADASADGAAASIRLSPVPLVCGEAFDGEVRLRALPPARLQEVRAEVRVHVEATVGQGLSETITAWSGQLAGEGSLGGDVTLAISGRLPSQPLPSIDLPHGRSSAQLHVILARPWAPDSHIVRDVAIATTREV